MLGDSLAAETRAIFLDRWRRLLRSRHHRDSTSPLYSRNEERECLFRRVRVLVPSPKLHRGVVRVLNRQARSQVSLQRRRNRESGLRSDAAGETSDSRVAGFANVAISASLLRSTVFVVSAPAECSSFALTLPLSLKEREAFFRGSLLRLMPCASDSARIEKRKV